MYIPVLWEDRIVQYPRRFSHESLGNGLYNVKPEPGEIEQRGTQQSATNFNHMDKGIHNNSLMLAVMLEQVMHNKRRVDAEAGELISVTLTNSRGFYDNNSAKTVALSRMRNHLNYRVYTEIQGDVLNAGDIVVYDKQLNGFKVKFTGSAKSVEVKCYVQGGVS